VGQFAPDLVGQHAPDLVGHFTPDLVGQYAPDYADCLLDLSSSKPDWFVKRQTVSDIMGCFGQKGCMGRYAKTNLALSYDGIVYIENTEAAKRMENIH